jgi:tetratricopeptide (TPR) repeat protein
LEPRSLRVKSILAHENGRYRESAQLLGKCIVLDPSFSGYQKQLAKVFVKMFWWKQALKSLNRAIYADPNDPESWYGLGFIYDHVKNLDNAKFCYTQSLVLDPSFCNARDALQTLNKIP